MSVDRWLDDSTPERWANAPYRYRPSPEHDYGWITPDVLEVAQKAWDRLHEDGFVREPEPEAVRTG